MLIHNRCTRKVIFPLSSICSFEGCMKKVRGKEEPLLQYILNSLDMSGNTEINKIFVPWFQELNWIRRIVLLGEYALKYCAVSCCFPNLYISYLFQQKQPLISHDFLNQSSFTFLFKTLSFPHQLLSEPINIKRWVISRKLKLCLGLSGSLDFYFLTNYFQI